MIKLIKGVFKYTKRCEDCEYYEEPFCNVPGGNCPYYVKD